MQAMDSHRQTTNMKDNNLNMNMKMMPELGTLTLNQPQIGAIEHTATVSKVQDQFAVLITQDNTVFELPTSLLPGITNSGQIIKLKLERCENQEEQRNNEIVSLQKQILLDPNFFESDI